MGIMEKTMETTLLGYIGIYVFKAWPLPIGVRQEKTALVRDQQAQHAPNRSETA